jgi:translation initiation factor 2B subunit (eIF-2B alpha/beta/delta family)
MRDGDVARAGVSLIKGNVNVYCHGFNENVVSLLLLAKKKRRKFVVYTTELQPINDGKKLERVLKKEGISVVIAPDMNCEHILEKCDLFLFGAELCDSRFMYSKIGTSLLCGLARDFSIPVYGVCPLDRFVSGKAKFTGETHMIDSVSSTLVSGVISELGIIGVTEFVRSAKK